MRWRSTSGEVLLGVEALHDHAGAAEAHRRRHRGLRCRVVQRRRRQVGHALAEAEHLLDEAHQRQAVAGRDVGQRAQDPLRPAGRARAVEHRRAELLVVDRRRRERGDGVVVGLERPDRRVGVDAAGTTSTFGVCVAASTATSALATEVKKHLGLAVVDDVGDLVGRQVRVDAREVQAAALGRALQLEVAQVVLQEHRHVVALDQAGGAEQVGEAVAVGLVLGERQLLARRLHEQRHLIGMLWHVPRGTCRRP